MLLVDFSTMIISVARIVLECLGGFNFVIWKSQISSNYKFIRWVSEEVNKYVQITILCKF